MAHSTRSVLLSLRHAAAHSRRRPRQRQGNGPPRRPRSLSPDRFWMEMINKLKISSSKVDEQVDIWPKQSKNDFFWKKTERCFLCVFFRFNGMLVRLNMRFFKFSGKSPAQSRKSPPNISRTLHTRHTAKWRLRQLHDEQSRFGRESYHINNPAVSVSVSTFFFQLMVQKIRQNQQLIW